MRNVIILIVLLALVGCCNQGCMKEGQKANTDQVQSKQTEQLVEEAQRQVGMPDIVNFQQRKLMKMIYELCDREDLICYAYIKSDYKGELFFIGKCIGFGIPFSAQFTNPERYFDDPNGSWDRGSIIVPQPDPNGLFMPTSSSATWLMMIDPENDEPRPVYLEPEIVVSPFPLHGK